MADVMSDQVYYWTWVDKTITVEQLWEDYQDWAMEYREMHSFCCWSVPKFGEWIDGMLESGELEEIPVDTHAPLGRGVLAIY